MFDPHQNRSSTVTAAHLGNGSQWRILLIDDDEDDYILFRDLLSDARKGRFLLKWVSSPQEAYKLVCSSLYDVVLVDFSLGQLSGIDIIRKAVSDGCQTPFILVTGYGSYEIDLEAMQAGAVDYLNKSDLTGVLLERTIRYAIKQKHTEQALAEANAALFRTNNELNQERSRLKALIENAPSGILFTNQEGSFTLANTEFTRLFKGGVIGDAEGFEGGTTLQTPRGDLLLPGEMPLVRALKGQSSQNEEIKVKFEDGHETYLLVNASPVYCEGNQIDGAVAIMQDISELKRVQFALADVNEALDKNRQELVEILESIRDGFLALDRDWRYIYINRRAANDRGREPKELLGKVIWEEFPQLVNSPVWFHYHQVMEQREPTHFEYEDPKNGKWYTISVYAVDRGISVYWLDKTPQKQAEQALEQSLVKLSRLIEVSSKIMAEKSVDGLLQVIIDAARDLTGAKIGTCGHRFVDGNFRLGVTSRSQGYQLCPPGERFSIEKGGVYKLLIDSVPSLRLTQAELYQHPQWRGLPKGHSPLKGLLGARLVDARGDPNGLIMISDKAEGEFTAEDEALLLQLAALASLSIQHIEARQSAEQSAALARRNAEEARVNAEQARQTAKEIDMERARLEAVLQQMPAGVVIAKAPEGKLILGNQNGSKILGTTFIQDEGFGEYHQCKGFQPDGSPYCSDEWPLARSLQHGEVIQGEEIIFQRADGSLGTMLVNSAPIYNYNKEITAAVEVFLDVTEQRRLEAKSIEYTAQMEVQRRLLEHREMERLQIARDLHDGPVQNMISLIFFVQSALDTNDDPVVLDILCVIKHSAQQLVEELRSYFKELRPPTLVKFGLEKAIRAHAEEFKVKNEGISLDLDLVEDLEMLPAGVRLALYRIYQESLNNVLRHAKARQVEVQFRFDREQINLEIRDDGAGFAMPNDWVELARQGHLGLVGMKERAEAVGGKLNVSSIPGKGTCVQVEVPWINEL